METYNWNVISINAIPILNNQSNVVAEVSYSVSNGKQSIIKKQLIPYNPSASFIPFSNLTNDQIIQWIQSILTPVGVTVIQNAVDALINPAALPSNLPIGQPLPWATPTSINSNLI
jgi:DNA polymerase III delta subunit